MGGRKESGGGDRGFPRCERGTGRVSNSRCAIALNGGTLPDEVVRAEIDRVSAATGLPCTDAVRFGGDVLLAAIG